MGNASGRSEGEVTSGDEYKEEGYGQEGMEFVAHGGGADVGYHAQTAYAGAEPTVHSTPHGPRGYLQPPLIFTPQVPMAPSPGPHEIIHVQNYAVTHNRTDFRDVFGEQERAVMITWSYDGKQVAVTGSWDNWERRELLHRSGKDFIVMKMLPSGIYHYRFIVDENLRYAPDLPWECDDSGTAYNILDVQESVPKAPESLSEFESPLSPVSSYNNESLNDDDFAKLPPDIPPQLQLTPLNDRSSVVDGHGHQSLPRPRHAVLNHLYIQNNNGQAIALGSTHRFLQKYVTVVLYKSSRR